MFLLLNQLRLSGQNILFLRIFNGLKVLVDIILNTVNGRTLFLSKTRLINALHVMLWQYHYSTQHLVRSINKPRRPFTLTIHNFIFNPQTTYLTVLR